MAIKYIQRFQEYVGLSTDDKSGITTDGAIIYYLDTSEREILSDGTWYTYVVNVDATLETGDLQIGAVELKDHDSETRANIDSKGLHTNIQGTNETDGTNGDSISYTEDPNGYPVTRIVDAAPYAYDSVNDKYKMESYYTTLIQGNLTLTGSAQQLDSDTSCKVVTIQANPDNVDYVYIGNANTVSNSLHMAVLSAGSTYTFTVSNVNLLYVIGTSGDKVSFGGEV